MNTDKFKAAYRASRNGTDSFHFNPLYRVFQYSDGVKEIAECGCYWLLDILGTELPAVFRAHPDHNLMTVSVRVTRGDVCKIVGSFADDSHDYVRKVDWTDMPEGTWEFLVAREEGKLCCILLTEY